MSIVANVQIVGLSRALDFRRSFNSQNNSDSVKNFNTVMVSNSASEVIGYTTSESVVLGPRDRKRLSSLVKSGDSHGKSTRFIDVYHDITFPRRVWVDMDTYRLGKLEGIRPDDIEYFSDSSMHTLTKPGQLTQAHFDYRTWKSTIEYLQLRIQDYENASDPEKKDEIFLEIKSNLPEGFLQTRSVKINYQALRHIYKDRVNHRQPEFRVYCDWIETLPLAAELITC